MIEWTDERIDEVACAWTMKKKAIDKIKQHYNGTTIFQLWTQKMQDTETSNIAYETQESKTNNCKSTQEKNFFSTQTVFFHHYHTTQYVGDFARNARHNERLDMTRHLIMDIDKTQHNKETRKKTLDLAKHKKIHRLHNQHTHIIKKNIQTSSKKIYKHSQKNIQ